MGVTAAVGAVVDTLGVAGTAAAGAAIGAGVAAATGGNALQGALMGGTVGFGGAELAGAAGLTGAAAGSTSDMIAADALSQQAQGLGADQIAQNLSQQYGIDQFAAQNVAGMATGGATAGQITSTLAADYGSNLTGLTTGAAPSLTGVLGTAKTGAQLIGGLGQLAQGYGQMQAGKAVTSQQAGPLSQYQPGFAAQLNNLLQNPSTITTTPGYQFNLSQGLQAQQAQQAAQGRLVSGGGLLQAQSFGQQYAQSSLQQQEQMLQQLTSMAPAQASAAQSTAFGNVGAQNYGIQSMAGGLGQVLNPLATLYSQYNNPSPQMNT
jgi:hypothetical protein